MGVEQRRLGDPSITLPVLGVILSLVVFFLPLDQMVLHTYANSLAFFFYSSIGLLAISLGAIVMVRIRTPPAGYYDVVFSRDRTSGVLRVIYTNTRGELRESLEVKSIKRNYRQLWRPGQTLMLPVEGTKCFLGLAFKRPRLGLALGFEDKEEMDKFYEQLK